jgi:anti-sigma factor (TIGR02949 family)
VGRANDDSNCADLDERLAPYVDGEATPESRRAVDAHLAVCPHCRNLADAEGAVRTIVRGHRDGLSAHASETLRARCGDIANRQSPIAIGTQQSSLHSSTGSRQSTIRRWAPLSLAATVLLAVAGVFLLGLNNRVEALASSLVIDHVKCFATTGNASRADPALSASRWQQDQGWQITVPPTESDEQLRLLNVRRCFTTEGRAAHLLYTWRGAPLSVYVLQENAGRDSVVDRMGHEAAIWCANGRTYAIVADGHPADLQHIVDYMKARVR